MFYTTGTDKQSGLAYSLEQILDLANLLDRTQLVIKVQHGNTEEDQEFCLVFSDLMLDGKSCKVLMLWRTETNSAKGKFTESAVQTHNSGDD